MPYIYPDTFSFSSRATAASSSAAALSLHEDLPDSENERELESFLDGVGTGKSQTSVVMDEGEGEGPDASRRERRHKKRRSDELGRTRLDKGKGRLVERKDESGPTQRVQPSTEEVREGVRKNKSRMRLSATGGEERGDVTLDPVEKVTIDSDTSGDLPSLSDLFPQKPSVPPPRALTTLADLTSQSHAPREHSPLNSFPVSDTPTLRTHSASTRKSVEPVQPPTLDDRYQEISDDDADDHEDSLGPLPPPIAMPSFLLPEKSVAACSGDLANGSETGLVQQPRQSAPSLERVDSLDSDIVISRSLLANKDHLLPQQGKKKSSKDPPTSPRSFISDPSQPFPPQSSGHRRLEGPEKSIDEDDQEDEDQRVLATFREGLMKFRNGGRASPAIGIEKDAKARINYFSKQVSRFRAGTSGSASSTSSEGGKKDQIDPVSLTKPLNSKKPNVSSAATTNSKPKSLQSSFSHLQTCPTCVQSWTSTKTSQAKYNHVVSCSKTRLIPLEERWKLCYLAVKNIRENLEAEWTKKVDGGKTLFESVVFGEKKGGGAKRKGKIRPEVDMVEGDDYLEDEGWEGEKKLLQKGSKDEEKKEKEYLKLVKKMKEDEGAFFRYGYGGPDGGDPHSKEGGAGEEKDAEQENGTVTINGTQKQREIAERGEELMSNFGGTGLTQVPPVSGNEGTWEAEFQDGQSLALMGEDSDDEGLKVGHQKLPLSPPSPHAHPPPTQAFPPSDLASRFTVIPSRATAGFPSNPPPGESVRSSSLPKSPSSSSLESLPTVTVAPKPSASAKSSFTKVSRQKNNSLWSLAGSDSGNEQLLSRTVNSFFPSTKPFSDHPPKSSKRPISTSTSSLLPSASIASTSKSKSKPNDVAIIERGGHCHGRVVDESSKEGSAPSAQEAEVSVSKEKGKGKGKGKVTGKAEEAAKGKGKGKTKGSSSSSRIEQENKGTKITSKSRGTNHQNGEASSSGSDIGDELRKRRREKRQMATPPSSPGASSAHSFSPPEGDAESPPISSAIPPSPESPSKETRKERMPRYSSWELDALQDEVKRYGLRPSRSKPAMANQLELIWKIMNGKEVTKKASPKAARKKTAGGVTRSKKGKSAIPSSRTSRRSRSRSRSPSPSPSPSPSVPRSRSISESGSEDEDESEAEVEAAEGVMGLEERLREAILADQRLYLRILRYEPIDFSVFIDLFELHNIKACRLKIRSFLDKMSITFYGENNGRDKSRGRDGKRRRHP